jgi:hypothetical protein
MAEDFAKLAKDVTERLKKVKETVAQKGEDLSIALLRRGFRHT